MEYYPSLYIYLNICLNVLNFNIFIFVYYKKIENIIANDIHSITRYPRARSTPAPPALAPTPDPRSRPCLSTRMDDFDWRFNERRRLATNNRYVLEAAEAAAEEAADKKWLKQIKKMQNERKKLMTFAPMKPRNKRKKPSSVVVPPALPAEFTTPSSSPAPPTDV